LRGWGGGGRGRYVRAREPVEAALAEVGVLCVRPSQLLAAGYNTASSLSQSDLRQPRGPPSISPPIRPRFCYRGLNITPTPSPSPPPFTIYFIVPPYTVSKNAPGGRVLKGEAAFPTQVGGLSKNLFAFFISCNRKNCFIDPN
jgi:hypothetical protein